MKYPNLYQEKRLWKKGYKIVVGLDEAGRGALTGPVVAGAVSILDTRYKIPSFTKVSEGRQNTKIRDSKQLTPRQRDKLYKAIVNDKNLEWGIGIVSEKVIDRINILEATKLAMKKAVRSLEKKLPRGKKFLILDGIMKLDLPIAQKSIIKGDEKVFSCAAASILAKVTRDRMMIKYHQKYPRYRFDLHKGYGTRKHFKLLKKYGPCPIHRKTFYPVSTMV
jgi:ribonuclease HII